MYSIRGWETGIGNAKTPSSVHGWLNPKMAGSVDVNYEARGYKGPTVYIEKTCV